MTTCVDLQDATMRRQLLKRGLRAFAGLAPDDAAAIVWPIETVLRDPAALSIYAGRLSMARA